MIVNDKTRNISFQIVTPCELAGLPATKVVGTVSIPGHMPEPAAVALRTAQKGLGPRVSVRDDSRVTWLRAQLFSRN